MKQIFYKEDHQCCGEKYLINQTKSDGKVTILTCEGCGLIFSSDHPDKQRSVNWYDYCLEGRALSWAKKYRTFAAIACGLVPFVGAYDGYINPHGPYTVFGFGVGAIIGVIFFLIFECLIMAVAQMMGDE